MEKDYCTQNNGDCSTFSLVNYGLDCINNPVAKASRKGTKWDRALANYDGHKGGQTIDHVKKLIGDDLADVLTGKQYGMVMSAINRAYHEGRASTGAEMIDSDAVFINSIGRAIEWTEEGAEYEQVVEDMGRGCKKTYSKKIKNGILVPKFTD